MSWFPYLSCRRMLPIKTLALFSLVSWCVWVRIRFYLSCLRIIRLSEAKDYALHSYAIFSAILSSNTASSPYFFFSCWNFFRHYVRLSHSNFFVSKDLFFFFLSLFPAFWITSSDFSSTYSSFNYFCWLFINFIFNDYIFYFSKFY